MLHDTETVLHDLVETISQHALVRAIGLSGGERPLPQAGAGDLDLFVYCTEVLTLPAREELLRTLTVGVDSIEIGRLERGHWGEGDSLRLAGIETWLLYFSLEETRLELDAVLRGQYPGRTGSYYYPIGRLAMWKTMRVLCDKDDVLSSIKRRIEIYPDELAHAILSDHLSALEDVEDLERAVQRHDVLFYHFALDLALDHLLQALFALNREYFPSRKRSVGFIRAFPLKPLECEHRLNEVVRLGGSAASLAQSYQIWSRVVKELCELAKGAESRKKGE